MAIVREKYYCGLDVGNKEIKVGIVKVKDSSWWPKARLSQAVLGLGESVLDREIELLGSDGHKTLGFSNGAVSDLGELADGIHASVQTLLRKVKVKLKEVYLGVGCDLVEVREADAVIPLVDRSANKIITHRDMKKVVDQARALNIQIDEEVLHDLPQYYTIDGANRAMDPSGLYGRKLGVHSLIILANANRVRNIVRAVHQAGYDVPHVFFNSYAAGEIALNASERAQGRIMMDIGSQVTDLLIFKDDTLKGFKKIPMGGDHFTQSIAQQLNLSFDLAEEIKKSHASTLSTDRTHDEEILVKKESAYRPVRHKDICSSMEPQVQRFLEYVREALAGMETLDCPDIIMIGGGALLTGLIERIGQAVNRPARLASMNIHCATGAMNTAVFSAVVGLAKKGFKQGVRYAIRSSSDNWTKNISNRLQELYYEYF